MISLFKRKKPKADTVSKGIAVKQKRYEALVYTLHADLFRYAFWLCHDRQVAEDLVQETFLRAWKALDSLKDEKAAKAWLITILRRENARRFERKQFDLVDLDNQQVPDKHSPGPEQDMENELLRRHIGELAIEYREPLLLQVIGGFSGEEIANILDLNKNTVMTRLFRARNQLKEALDNDKTIRGRNNG
ncbi:sigma-70 family RNA polymerase sigma factor [Zobellella maritima]|uniref:sigma-70 family RNA polymerase sigma factor n=1 Tax=Zobellella maritima TaxID=2059725 RepID=UPI000E30A166|nr:sigma-70 family RNA polymerase sigma factor [Zobellella maritima]